MGDRVSTAGADFLADAPPLKRLVLRRRSLAAKERKERKAGMSLLCGPCVLSRLEIGNGGGFAALTIERKRARATERWFGSLLKLHCGN